MDESYIFPSLQKIARDSKGGVREFQGTFRFLSNFWPLPSGATLEHHYQAAKCVNAADAEKIMEAATPGIAKRLGRSVKCRPDWNSIKVGVMKNLLLMKFRPGSPLAEALLATGNAWLREGNTWGDTFWGICNGRGSNVLGKLLMQVRSELALREVKRSLAIALDDEGRD